MTALKSLNGKVPNDTERGWSQKWNQEVSQMQDKIKKGLVKQHNELSQRIFKKLEEEEE